MDNLSVGLTTAASVEPGDRGFDCLIVGAGFAGSVPAERVARVDGTRVLIVDQRPDIGGTAHDRDGDDGVPVRPFGRLVFRTDSADICECLSAFTAWRPTALLAWRVRFAMITAGWKIVWMAHFRSAGCGAISSDIRDPARQRRT